MSKILDKHVLLKGLSKYKLKFETKPWIATALQKSISIKNKLFSDFIKKKTLLRKLNFILNIKAKQKHVICVYEEKQTKQFHQVS